MRNFFRNLILATALLYSFPSFSQIVIKGEIVDANNGEPLIGASVYAAATGEGAVADFDGSFELKIKGELPIKLSISFTGYEEQILEVKTAGTKLNIKLIETSILINAIEIREKRISDKQKESPLTVEAMDIIAIKETAQVDFYKGLGALKGVDLTTASLGFTIINMRGFNSTSPVRSLQVIDGVDNASPGLNFSLGNFLGAPELDVLKVELVAGASSAYYGPNAFNGVIDMTTKDPFHHKGLSVSLKGGERSLFEGAIRWADAFKNKDGQEKFGYKFNLFYLQANDWEATNYDPTPQSKVGADNPGGYDAVNIYGDENTDNSRNYAPSDTSTLLKEFPGLGNFYRKGYKEVDLVDYNTRNMKGNIGAYYKITPNIELIGGVSAGNGTTVYQGENRFSLKGIQFWQYKMELRQPGKFFLRAYRTQEDAGESYDAYFTALLLQEAAKTNRNWTSAYTNYWQIFNNAKVRNLEGYPPSTSPFDFETQAAVLAANQDQLASWHAEAQNAANSGTLQNPDGFYFEPGTVRFDSLFQLITSRLPTDSLRGTRFFDQSALNHVHGQFEHAFDFAKIVVGGNYRLYQPNSKGTIFADTAGTEIRNWEVGGYVGLEKKFFSSKVKANATLRVDKNQNFNAVASPAASLVWSPDINNIFRLSFSAAVRNPTLADQYLNYNVGRAILRGNITGVDSLVTVPSVISTFNSLSADSLVYFNVDAIRPEKVKTIEVGWRGTVFNAIWIDANYYYSFYDDFIGYQLGVDFKYYYDFFGRLTPTTVQAYRVSSNAISAVTTQGFSIGMNYYFPKYLVFNGNYSWNKLNKKGTDDPLIPAYNTPAHKFNLGISGREMTASLGAINLHYGFSLNYKWIQGFTFEGSPQFTGRIPTYDLLDAQVNFALKKINTTLKIGASNVLNQKQVQTDGGPRVGRLAYVSLLYEFKKRD